MEKSRLGRWAKIGDLVELLDPRMNPTGVTGLVTDAYTDQGFGDFDDSHLHGRFLKLSSMPHNQINDLYVRILSFAN